MYEDGDIRKQLYTKNENDNMVLKYAGKEGGSPKETNIPLIRISEMYLNRAEAIAHSAKFEGLPTVMIESLIMGKLIVATDCPTGPREILDNGQTGLLTPVGNAEALAEALHRILTDESLQAAILAHAKEYKQQFLFNHAGKLFDEVIHS